MKIEDIIKGPVLTEKATSLAARKVYMFEVEKKANKNQIKEALEKIYPLKIEKVTVVQRKGKMKRPGKRMRPKTLPDRKIAYVKVLEGKIDLFPQA